MLLVQTTIAKSPIHGFGLFAVSFIEKGTHIWRFTPEFDLELEPDRLNHLSEASRQTMLHYGYIDPASRQFILCSDDYRFVNHSDSPNVRIDKTEDRHGVDIAARDIQPGEEITVDYNDVEGSRP